MVVDRFTRGARPVYERAAERGRMLPPAVEYVDSAVAEDLGRCFQLMKTAHPSLLDAWIAE